MAKLLQFFLIDMDTTNHNKNTKVSFPRGFRVHHESSGRNPLRHVSSPEDPERKDGNLEWFKSGDKHHTIFHELTWNAWNAFGFIHQYSSYLSYKIYIFGMCHMCIFHNSTTSPVTSDKKRRSESDRGRNKNHFGCCFKWRYEVSFLCLKQSDVQQHIHTWTLQGVPNGW